MSVSVSSEPTIGEGRGSELRHLPNPDYENHPAYGQAFPLPTIGLRVKALSRFLPWFGLVALKRVFLFDRLPTLPDYGGPMATGLFGRVMAAPRYLPLIARGLAQQARLKIRVVRVDHTPESERILETFARDGIVVERLLFEEKATLLRLLAAPLSKLIEQRERSAQPSFEGNQAWLNEVEYGEIFSLLSQVLSRHGISKAASAYLRRPVKIRHLTLQINDARDSYHHRKFADVGVSDPASNYMHVDTTHEMVKCMIYLSEVGDANGPFCYVRGSARMKVGFVEGLARRATDRAGLSGYSPATRQLFMALPRLFRKKCTFGSDLLDKSDDVRRLLAAEYRFTSADGDVAMFDNLGVHRGAIVREGERRVLIANLS